MRFIKSSFNVITLNDLLVEYSMGRVPDNAVVVTFDDGYYDFFEYAFPIMKEENIKPTIFLTTGFVNGELWLWPDKIRYALDHTSLSVLSVDGIPEYLDLVEHKERAWHIISDYCLTLENTKKECFIINLYNSLNVDVPIDAPKAYKAVTWQQVKEMMDAGLEVGSHSHSHPILTKLSDAQLFRELTKSKDLIKEKLNLSTNIFCYPNGQRVDFNEKIKKSVVDSSYRYAVSAFPSTEPLKDLLEINRYSIDDNMENFHKVLFGLTYMANKMVNIAHEDKRYKK